MERTMEERINNFCNRETKALADITFRYKLACATTEACICEGIYNTYSCEAKFKSVLEDIKAELIEIKRIAETDEIPMEIYNERLEALKKIKLKAQESKRKYMKNIEEIKENVLNFENQCNSELFKVEFYLAFNEKLLDGNLQAKSAVTEQQIAEIYKNAKIDLSSSIGSMTKYAEVLDIPQGVLSHNIEKFQDIKNGLAYRKKKYTEAFKTLEQKVAAQ